MNDKGYFYNAKESKWWLYVYDSNNDIYYIEYGKSFEKRLGCKYIGDEISYEIKIIEEEGYIEVLFFNFSESATYIKYNKEKERTNDNIDFDFFKKILNIENENRIIKKDRITKKTFMEELYLL